MKLKNLFLLAFVFTVSMLHAQSNKNNHTFLGVDVNTMTENIDGLYVNGVYKGYGAEHAGLKSGDILRTVNSKPVRSFDELVQTLDNYKPGQQVELSYSRNNAVHIVNASLSEYPEFLKYNSGDFLKDGESREMRRAKLGVNIESMWEQYALLVTGFTNNSPAQKAGLQVGDVILKMDNYEFVSMEELKYYLSKYKPADVVTLTIKRDGQQKLMKVTLGEELKHMKEKKEVKEKKETKEFKEKIETKEVKVEKS